MGEKKKNENGIEEIDELMAMLLEDEGGEPLFNPDDHLVHHEGSKLESVMKLNKDLKEVAKNMTEKELRYVVDIFKILQKLRIHLSNQLFSMSDEPKALLNHLFENVKSLEAQTTTTMKLCVENKPTGQWLKSIKGVGEVTSATLLAYLDIEKADTAGDFWAYAGYDPNRKWITSEDEAKKIINRALANIHNSLETNTKTVLNSDSMKHTLKFNNKERILNFTLSDKSYPESGVEIKAKTDYETFIIHIAKELGIKTESLKKRFLYELKVGDKSTFDDIALSASKLLMAIKIRPHHAKLKSALFVMTDCFIKTKNKPDSIYGKIIQERLVYEKEKNERGDYADQANASLAKLKDKTTITYKRNSEGKLSDGHLLMRARRYAAKLFLSHLHYVMYKDRFKKEPPKPFAIDHLDHAHIIYPPNLDIIDKKDYKVNKKSIIEIVKDSFDFMRSQFRDRNN